MRLLAISSLLALVLAAPAQAKLGDCGQPMSDGERPSLGDVLYILGAALNRTDCPAAICDVDDDCRVTLRDALRTLRHAVGGQAELRCEGDCPSEPRRCGDTEAPMCGGACPENHECRVVERDLRVPICHIPPGNPENAHTLWIAREAVRAHLDHGDYLGRCRDDEGDREGHEEDFRATTWWWRPELRCECEPATTSTTVTTTTVTVTSTVTSTSTTTTTVETGGDADNDGILDDMDPCLGDARNLCVGPVAVDAATGNEIRVNAGVLGAACSGAKTDCTGAVWSADFGYNVAESATDCKAPGGCPIEGVVDLFGCTDEATQDLFRCEHWDAGTPPELEYSFDVPDGQYVVNVFFANTFEGTAAIGARLIDILVEGVVAYASFDQMAASGGITQTAVVRSVVVAVDDGNGLQISFGHVLENPAVKAIEVLDVD